MKKFASLLIAALTLFAACDEKGPHGPVSYYSISGEISDADGDLLRLTATPIIVRLTDGKGQCVASEEFFLTEENRSFILTGIPAGKYSLEFYPGPVFPGAAVPEGYGSVRHQKNQEQKDG